MIKIYRTGNRTQTMRLDPGVYSISQNYQFHKMLKNHITMNLCMYVCTNQITISQKILNRFQWKFNSKNRSILNYSTLIQL